MQRIINSFYTFIIVISGDLKKHSLLYYFLVKSSEFWVAFALAILHVTASEN